MALLGFSMFSLVNVSETSLAQAPVTTVDTLGFLNDSSRDYYRVVPYPSEDIRAVVLKEFFRVYPSPLVDFVEVLVKQADIWGLDYALLPAIAMQESGGCKTIPTGSYNCWGYGIYGDKTVSFGNFEEAITRIAKTLKETYIKNGLTNATLVEDRWTPLSRGNWSYSVNFFIGKIREIETKLSST